MRWLMQILRTSQELNFKKGFKKMKLKATRKNITENLTRTQF